MSFLALPYGLVVAAEIGLAVKQPGDDGTWIQRGFPHKEQLAAPSASIGLARGRWGAGYTHLIRVSHSSLATVRDEDYDLSKHACIQRCDTAADFRGVAQVRGWYLRYEQPLSSGLFAEVGGLLYKVQQTIDLTGWRQDGLKENAVVPPAHYVRSANWSVAPSLGFGYRGENWRVVVRGYYPIEASGHWMGSVVRGVVGQVMFGMRF